MRTEVARTQKRKIKNETGKGKGTKKKESEASWSRYIVLLLRSRGLVWRGLGFGGWGGWGGGLGKRNGHRARAGRALGKEVRICGERSYAYKDRL